MSIIRLQVISLQGVFLDEMVDFFKFQGPMGQTGILKNHAPLLTLMKSGSFTYQKHSTSTTFHTLGGIVEVYGNKAVVLADYCSAEQGDLLVIRAKENVKKNKSDNQQSRSFHQLYSELARSPEDLEALKGIGQLRSKSGSSN